MTYILAAINPKGLVPAIEYQNKPLYESLIISEFLEDAFPTHKPHLLPADPFTRAQARLWIDHISKAVIPAFQRLLQSQEAPKQAAALEELKTALRTLAQNAKGPYFFGEEWSLIDTAIAPWVTRDYIQQEHRGYKREDVSPEWVAYADKLETRESVVKTRSVSLFLSCSQRGTYAETCKTRRSAITNLSMAGTCATKLRVRPQRPFGQEESSRKRTSIGVPISVRSLYVPKCQSQRVFLRSVLKSQRNLL